MNKHEKNHRALWNELARTGEQKKENAVLSLNLPEVFADCYACEYDYSKNGDCQKCPINWGLYQNYCDVDEESPYIKWCRAKTPRTRKKYAKIIANLKWINRR